MVEFLFIFYDQLGVNFSNGKFGQTRHWVSESIEQTILIKIYLFKPKYFFSMKIILLSKLTPIKISFDIKNNKATNQVYFKINLIIFILENFTFLQKKYNLKTTCTFPFFNTSLNPIQLFLSSTLSFLQLFQNEKWRKEKLRKSRGTKCLQR
ncbi:hypothetical protein BpHYR1_023441 [Brachionus plicatilis]|uniref:Uncharacterized protein n=1 Tax=Brachionus plicatilis TaxID=10195 RepID=A0A3M7Q5P2_BRAPC|nr:hypothetical protein BpHYR1_023441 [Brachionus plicatilis]